MTYDRFEKEYGQERTTVENVCGISVRLIFAGENNCEVPEIVGDILKGAYLQRQSV